VGPDWLAEVFGSNRSWVIGLGVGGDQGRKKRQKKGSRRNFTFHMILRGIFKGLIRT
jgi:hypothetical protein